MCIVFKCEDVAGAYMQTWLYPAMLDIDNASAISIANLQNYFLFT